MLMVKVDDSGFIVSKVTMRGQLVLRVATTCMLLLCICIYTLQYKWVLINVKQMGASHISSAHKIIDGNTMVPSESNDSQAEKDRQKMNTTISQKLDNTELNFIKSQFEKSRTAPDNTFYNWSNYYYLLPRNFILSKIYPNPTDAEKDFIQKAMWSNSGLPHTDNQHLQKGETKQDKQNGSSSTTSNITWEDNGVIFKTYNSTTARITDYTKIQRRYKIQSSYSPQFEEYIPFDQYKFFIDGRRSFTEFTENPKKKKIMLWHTKTRYFPPTPELQQLRVCPDFPCVITTNTSYINESDAMLFAAQLLDPTPPPRRPDQVFVLHNHEGPYAVYTKRFQRRGQRSPWTDAFNWTMTFRMDSDIPAFYGVIQKLPDEAASLHEKDYQHILSKKTGLVAWLVSNCAGPSKRMEYVKELQKFIPVSIFGYCGNLRCGSRETDAKCSELFSSRYKFYLSFESDICQDYITEKMFKYISLDLIVVGRASNEYYRHIPSDTFINAADFSSPKELAERLLFLDKNDEAYIQLLRNKDRYVSIFQDYATRRDESIVYMTYHRDEVSLCHICYRLWNLGVFSKTVPDIFQWIDRGLCYRKT